MADVAIRIDPGAGGGYGPGSWQDAEGRWLDQTRTWDGPWTYSGAFEDVSRFAYSASVRRGRQDETEPFGAASAQVGLRNLDGRFDPDGLFPLRLRQPIQIRSSLYAYGPGTWAEATGTWADAGTTTWLGPAVFTGFVEDVDLTYDTSGDAEVRIAAVDGLSIVSNQELLDVAVPEENGGARIERVLGAPGVTFPGTTDIEAGITPMGAGTAAGNVTEYLRRIATSEQGRLFVDRDGVLVFRNRRAPFSTPVVFADDGTGYAYSTIERYSGARALFNRVLGKRVGGVTFAYNDERSQDEFNVRTLDIGELLTATDTFVQGIVENLALLFARPRTRVFQASVIVDRLDQAGEYALLELDFMSAADVKFTPPGADQITNTLLIQGIEHSITVSGTWTSTFYFEERPTGTFLTLDDATLGRLNLNPMAF